MKAIVLPLSHMSPSKGDFIDTLTLRIRDAACKTASDACEQSLTNVTNYLCCERFSQARASQEDGAMSQVPEGTDGW